MVKAWEATVRKTQAAAKRRAHSIFGTTSVAHADDEEEEEPQESVRANGETYHADRVLCNGDYYTGLWADNFPHGQGKYLWTDGCMYIGEWFRGKTMGKGKFSWPSGATYEGEFKSGYMDGKGTYTGNNGDTYKGQWVMNLRHGRGIKSYVNGDIYDGEWRRGLQEGHGKYLWKNGNQYVGEWKNGVICGKGTMSWTNGNRYDGYWEDGLPKGNGTFRWADGSFYMGNWSKDPDEQNGTFYPSGTSPEATLEWDPQHVFNVDLSDCKVSAGEKVSIMPSQKKLAVWRSSKSVDTNIRPRRMSVDGRMSPMNMLDDGDRSFDSADSDSIVGSLDESLLEAGQQNRAPRTVKRQGETISKGHKNYELMLNLQLGIRYYPHSFFFMRAPFNYSLFLFFFVGGFSISFWVIIRFVQIL